MTSSGIITKKTLSTLKVKDLKSLALSIGAASSGTKDVLSSTLWDELQRPRISSNGTSNAPQVGESLGTPEKKILSIDMGIKNFAYSTIALPRQWAVPFNLNGALTPLAAPTTRPKLLEWSRLNMLTYNVIEGQSAEDEQPGDHFHPKHLAEFANHIVEHLVLKPKSPGGAPDTILIERQRFRTMGSSVVQEWTLRVNMLEAMLWAALHAEKQRGTWHGEVHGVLPSLVAGWWQARDNVESLGYSGLPEGGAKLEKLSAKQKKQVRIQRAAMCLSEVVTIAEPAAQATYEAYMRRLSRAKGQRTKNTHIDSVHLQKLDDLADCLLQALTWLVWEQNRRGLLMMDSAAGALRSFLQGS